MLHLKSDKSHNVLSFFIAGYVIPHLILLSQIYSHIHQIEYGYTRISPTIFYKFIHHIITLTYHGVYRICYMYTYERVYTNMSVLRTRSQQGDRM